MNKSRRLPFPLAIVVSIGLAACGGKDPAAGQRSVDCFPASPSTRPTASEVQRFTGTRWPATAEVLRTGCDGGIDMRVTAQVRLDAGDVPAFLKASGFRRQADPEADFKRDDRTADGVNRRVKVRFVDGRALVNLEGFTT